jgi:hypothetical protein
VIKSLAIYGDSFGTHSLSGDYASQLKGLSHHWSTLLKQEYNCELTNYALPGSSVYYAFSEFEKTNHLHDLSIFLVTESGRYLKPLTLSKGGRDCVTNIAQIDVWRKNKIHDLTNEDLELLSKLESWFDLSDSDYHYDMSELMVDKVRSFGSRVIVIPCFSISFRNEYQDKLGLSDDISLCSLYYAQMKELNMSDEGMNTKWVENSEFISGHLTPEWNKIAYENISYYIKNRVWNWNIPNSKIIDTPNKDNYYIKL